MAGTALCTTDRTRYSCVPLALTLKSRNTEDKCMAIEYTQ